MSKGLHYAMVVEFMDDNHNRLDQDVYAFSSKHPEDFIKDLQNDLPEGLNAYIVIVYECREEHVADGIAEFLADLCQDYWLTEREACCGSKRKSPMTTPKNGAKKLNVKR
jgi:hypothetical protein